MVSHPGNAPIMKVNRIKDWLVLNVFGGFSMDDFRGLGLPRDTILTIVEDMTNEVNTDVQHGTLFYLHWCMGHLSSDTIIKMARDPASGIKLTDTKRVNYLACAHGKKTTTIADGSGLNSPIDVIGGVVCSGTGRSYDLP